MNGGIKVLLATAALASAGCTADSGELNIRSIADPLTKAIKPGNPMIAEARGLLALGNVGLAIEAYRKVLRAQPDSVEALAGLAECYDQMGRPDLSRAKYEAALAIAPNNPILLRTFAASLERQGRRAEGQALRAEADGAEAEEVAALARIAPAEVVAVQSAPPAAPAKTSVASTPVPAPVKVAITRPPAAAAPVKVVAATSPAPAATPLAGTTKWTVEVPAARPSASVTVKLPPASPPHTESLGDAVEAALVTVNLAPTVKPDPAPAKAMLAKAAPAGKGPRLERLSLGEVALVTSSKPRWRPELVRRTALSTTVRFVPLRPATRYAGVRLLNAARHQGLAARTRLALNHTGWNRVTIGDAARVRQRSLVLYSPATAQAARRLAAEFGFGIAKDSRPGPLTVLLGRDSIGRAQSGS